MQDLDILGGGRFLVTTYERRRVVVRALTRTGPGRVVRRFRSGSCAGEEREFSDMPLTDVWEPGIVAFAESQCLTDDERYGIGVETPMRLVATQGHSVNELCRPRSRDRYVRRTQDLRVFIGRAQHLQVCTTGGRLLQSTRPSDDREETDDYTTLRRIAVIGDVVLTRSTTHSAQGSFDGPPPSSTQTFVATTVNDPGARQSGLRPHDVTSFGFGERSVAWTFTRVLPPVDGRTGYQAELWVSDAAGTRRVAVSDGDLVITSTEGQRVSYRTRQAGADTEPVAHELTLRPLPARDVADDNRGFLDAKSTIGK